MFKVKRLSLALLFPFLPLGCGDSEYKPPVAPSASASADGTPGASKIEPTKRGTARDGPREEATSSPRGSGWRTVIGKLGPQIGRGGRANDHLDLFA